MKTRGSAAKALQDAKDFITANDSKRKRADFEVADSEDDELLDDTPNARRTRHDEEVARQLQEEFYRDANALPSEIEDSELQDEESEDSEHPSVPDLKGKGKAVARPQPRTRRSAGKASVPDSDEAEESSDSAEREPPTKRQKKAVVAGAKASGKGKGKMPAVPSDSEDDVPRELLNFSHSYPQFLEDTVDASIFLGVKYFLKYDPVLTNVPQLPLHAHKS